MSNSCLFGCQRSCTNCCWIYFNYLFDNRKILPAQRKGQVSRFGGKKIRVGSSQQVQALGRVETGEKIKKTGQSFLAAKLSRVITKLINHYPQTF